eukprot:SAG11_NODE_16464_length_546_cov_1.624161_1_plen_181_part_11
MDVQIGRLRSMLKTHGVADNTFLLFTSVSAHVTTICVPATLFIPGVQPCHRRLTFVVTLQDNGPAKRQISTQGLRQCKGSVFEGGIREPGLIEFPPKIKTNTKSSAIVGTWDFMPTVLELLGLPRHPPAPATDWPIDGVSLVPLLDQLASGSGSSWARGAPVFWFSGEQVAMLDWPWKYVL